MAIYKDLKKEIETKETELLKLRHLLKQKCPHNDIIKTSYCDDDYAQYKTYTHTYKCTFCNLWASSENSSESNQRMYEQLQKKYEKNNKKG